MGKKVRGASLRAKKRSRACLEALQEQQAEQVTTHHVAKRRNEELFVVDTKGADVPKGLLPDSSMNQNQQKKQKKKHSELSQKDQQQIEKLLQTYPAEKLEKMVKEGQRWCPEKHKDRPLYYGEAPHKGKTQARFDLWNSEETKNRKKEEVNNSKTGVVAAEPEKQKQQTQQALVVAGTAPLHVSYKPRGFKERQERIESYKNKKKHQLAVVDPDPKAIAMTAATAIEVAHDGQSYHPDPMAHQQVLRRALEQEQARMAAEQYQKTPVSVGMSPETRALLVGDSDTSDEDDSDSDDEEEDKEEEVGNVDHPENTDNKDDMKKKKQDDHVGLSPVGPIPKRAHKLTRAQRNKQKRVRREHAIQAKQRTMKKRMNAVAEIPRYKKELLRQEQQRLLDKQQKEAAAAAAAALAGKKVQEKVVRANPLLAPTWPVALSTELSQQTSALRQIKPKGSLLTDRMHSMTDRKLAPALSVAAPTTATGTSVATAPAAVSTDWKQTRRAALHADTRIKEEKRRRGLAVKGSKNNQGGSLVGSNFVILGV